jgi:DNA-binding MarR family transcriptional regulator
MADVLMLPDGPRQLMTWMVRQGSVSVVEAAARADLDESAVAAMLDALGEQGFVFKTGDDGTARYRARLVSARGRPTRPKLWDALEL